ncbi:hypothetical protein [Actinoplanes sp. NPDC049802]|uniref:hypothetical protein n=1 Tax=Actinoplanes sp. NPDC049802 TaxID=3154742 RepID=UPI0033E4C0E1
MTSTPPTLDATVVEEDIDIEGMWNATDDGSIRTVGVTDVSGGCIVSQHRITWDCLWAVHR